MRLRARGRRSPRDGRASEAIREVRPDAAPGEDAACSRSTHRASEAAGRQGAIREPSISWASRTTGREATREVGHQAQDSQGEVSAGIEGNRGVVPRPPSPPHSGATPDIGPEAKGAFRLLRNNRERQALQRFRFKAQCLWHKWLARRSNKGMKWERFENLLVAFPLPRAIAIHSMLRRAANPVS